jgi:CrcB protein
MMVASLLVAMGGAAGSLARYWVSVLVVRMIGGEAFPWATLIINVAGSFVIGVFAALTGAEGRLAGDTTTRLLVMVGICGGFTTFSSFSLQTLVLLRSGEMLPALLNIAASVLLCLLATAAGIALVTRS